MGSREEDAGRQLSSITKLEYDIARNLEHYNKLQNYKYYALLISLVVFFLLAQYLVHGIEYAYFSTRSNGVLRPHINAIVPPGYEVNNIVDDVKDVMFLSWDVNNRSPRFFSKWTKNTHKGDPAADYDFTLDQMVFASASNLRYFHPYVKAGNLYVSGENVAVSPAMYAFLQAHQQMNVTQEDIRLVSIGGVDTNSEKISGKMSIVDWAERLRYLYHPAKKHTMNFFT